MMKRQSGLSDFNVGLLGALPYAALFFRDACEWLAL